LSRLVDAAHAAAQTDGVNVFGAGGFARDLARALRGQGVTVHALLTSSAPSRDSVDGLPVRQIDAAALAAAPLWVGVFNREAHSDYGTVSAFVRGMHPGARIVWPQTAYEWLAPALGFRFWLHDRAGYAAVAERIAAARALLDDEPSRQAFDRLVAFRSQAASFEAPPAQDAGVQYLPDWLRRHLVEQGSGSLRIAEGGAYRGETLRELATLMPIEQAWTFEPDPDNYAALVQQMADWPAPVTHLPAGLSDAAGSALFTTGQGEASHLGAAAGDGSAQRVPLVSVDGCLHRADINFLKLDVEGHELAALNGARATIARCRPTLAIAAYHRWDDLWRLPEWIDELSREAGLNYRLRLGLHGHNSFDLVLYAF
jgi:FkbM family methyltransferase